MNIGIIGGGLLGLSAGYELAKSGHRVTVLEKEPELGGQASTFTMGGGRLERFYHHIFTVDRNIIALIQEVGLGPKLLWLTPRAGFCHGGQLYNFVTPWDLLRFRPIGLPDRLRLGLVSLYLRRLKEWRRLEGVTAREWIIRWAGRRNYEVVWGPLLRGKFGERAGEVGMAWFWGKINLRFASRGRWGLREKLGYLQGSFGLLVDELARAIRERGGQVLTDSPVRRIVGEGGRVAGVEVVGRSDKLEFDAVIATVPSPTFLEMAPDLGEYGARLKQAQYQWAACLTLVLEQPLSPIYWLNISDPAIPFVAAIEHTNFISSSEYGGKHILYLSNYVAPGSPLTSAPAQEVLNLYLPSLRRINPLFQGSWVQEYHLFREPAAQPVVGVNYSRDIPGHDTPLKGLYLANTTQIYPQDRGMNYSVRLGQQVARLVAGHRA